MTCVLVADVSDAMCFLQSSSHSPEDGQHRLTEISRHLLNLNSSFQNYHMVLPQASHNHQKTPWKATENLFSFLKGKY